MYDNFPIYAFEFWLAPVGFGIKKHRKRITTKEIIGLSHDQVVLFKEFSDIV